MCEEKNKQSCCHGKEPRGEKGHQDNCCGHESEKHEAGCCKTDKKKHSCC